MIEMVIEGRGRDLGGFGVARILPFARRRMVGPFVFLDHMGPARFPPGGGIDVRPHPHIGLATVTWLFEGRIVHRDSTGAHQAIEPGAVNWMVAGRGISHSERTDPADRAAGWSLHGMQAWVALPDAHEEAEPSFHHVPATALPVIEGQGFRATLIAGAAFGAVSPVPVQSALFYLDVRLESGAGVALPEGYRERAAYVAAGTVICDGQQLGTGQMAVFAAGGTAQLTAVGGPAILMLLGGEPVGPRQLWWNLVASRPELMERAKADWAAGRFPLPPGDNHEFIPLPEA